MDFVLVLIGTGNKLHLQKRFQGTLCDKLLQDIFDIPRIQLVIVIGLIQKIALYLFCVEYLRIRYESIPKNSNFLFHN
jgi:hypothetical protein